MLCEQVLGKLHDFDITGKTIEYVDIEWHEAFKKIHKKITDKGTEVGIRMDDSILARGLYQDDVIYADNRICFYIQRTYLERSYECIPPFRSYRNYRNWYGTGLPDRRD